MIVERDALRVDRARIKEELETIKRDRTPRDPLVSGDNDDGTTLEETLEGEPAP